MLCLSCGRLSPSPARYCGHCGRSFRGRYCRHGHVSPRWARRCLECGDGKLTAPTPYVPTGWLTRGLSWLLVLLALRLLWRHPEPLRRAGAGALGWLGLSPAAVAGLVQGAIVWGVLFLMLLTLLPERVSRPLGKVVLGSARVLLRGAGAVLPQVLRSLRRIAGGP